MAVGSICDAYSASGFQSQKFFSFSQAPPNKEAFWGTLAYNKELKGLYQNLRTRKAKDGELWINHQHTFAIVKHG